MASTTAKVPNDPVPLPPTYEAAIAELEDLVLRLDAGQLPLDTLLQQYQRGEALLQFCRSRLEVLEQQVSVIEDDGRARPWTGDAP